MVVDGSPQSNHQSSYVRRRGHHYYIWLYHCTSIYLHYKYSKSIVGYQLASDYIVVYKHVYIFKYIFKYIHIYIQAHYIINIVINHSCLLDTSIISSTMLFFSDQLLSISDVGYRKNHQRRFTKQSSHHSYLQSGKTYRHESHFLEQIKRLVKCQKRRPCNSDISQYFPCSLC